MSASVAVLMTLTPLPHLMWSPLTATDRFMLVACAVTAFAVLLIILLRGSDFSLSAGLSSLALAMTGIYLFIGLAASEQLVLNAVLLVPVIALMLGWFVTEAYARTAMIIAIGILVIIVSVRGQQFDWVVLSVTTTIYIAILTGFLFEVGTFVHRRTKHRASIDPLTGALNRYGFWRDGAIELRRSRRQGDPVTLVTVDFDEFKKLNDTRGHLAGDDALRRATAHWRASIRPYDLIVRLGGDEFALLLIGVSTENAIDLVRRLREQSEAPWSWGLAEWDREESLGELLARADAELLRSRRPS